MVLGGARLVQLFLGLCPFRRGQQPKAEECIGNHEEREWQSGNGGAFAAGEQVERDTVAEQDRPDMTEDHQPGLGEPDQSDGVEAVEKAGGSLTVTNAAATE